MCLHNRFDETQPESQAALRAALVTTVQAFPDVRNLLHGDSHPRVAHFDNDFGDMLLGSDVNAATVRRVFDRIVQKVHEYLLQTSPVGTADDGFGIIDSDGHLLVLGNQLMCAECHIHPANKNWQQQDFWGMAAFFRKTRADRPKSKNPNDVLAKITDEPGPPPQRAELLLGTVFSQC